MRAFFTVSIQENKAIFFAWFSLKIVILGGCGVPWAPPGRIAASEVDFLRFFGDILEAFGAHWRPLVLPEGPTLAILQLLSHPFAAPGQHGWHHAVRTLFLPSPGEEKVTFWGGPDVAYI